MRRPTSKINPKHVKDSLPYSQVLRVPQICSWIEDFDKHAAMMASHFICRGYPLHVIEAAVLKAHHQDCTILLEPVRAPAALGGTEQQSFLITTHHGLLAAICALGGRASGGDLAPGW